jgi:putative transposase
MRLCQTMGVSPSGFYAWDSRPPSARAQVDALLREQIETIYIRSRRTYGAPRVHAELRALGVRSGRKRVARLMREAGLVGVHRRRPPRTTWRDRDVAPAPDLVHRQFATPAPNRLWVADITYVRTGAGWLYLAVVLDAFSRRVVGWAMSGLLEATLVLDALNMALWNRRPAPGVVHHSDHGAQYTSLAYGRRCQEAGIVPSMGSAGDAYDNALAEAFFATLETELLMRRRFIDRGTARRALFDYIEGWYNPHRRHSALGYLSPAEFERRWWQQPNAAQGTVSTEMESAAGG